MKVRKQSKCIKKKKEKNERINTWRANCQRVAYKLEKDENANVATFKRKAYNNYDWVLTINLN